MSDRESSGIASRGWRRKWPGLAAAGVLVLACLAAAWWLWFREKVTDHDPEPYAAVDPRLTFPTPYRNVRPDVRYVGDRACIDCHRVQADPYRHHPMGQALAPTAEATPIEKFDSATQNPFTVSGIHYGIAGTVGNTPGMARRAERAASRRTAG